MRRLLWLCLSSFSASLWAQSHTVQSLLNPKAGQGQSYVCNPDDLLGYAATDSLNTWIETLERQATAQIAVVALADLPSSDTRRFGQELFEHWDIGQSDINNGLLILFVRDKRKINFITGYGLEAVLSDLTCKAIQEEYMLPDFKAERYEQGLLRGVKATVELLKDPSIRNSILSQKEFPSNWSWALLPLPVKGYLVAILLYSLIFISVVGMGHVRSRPFQNYKRVAAFFHPAIWLPFVLASLAVSFLTFGWIEWRVLLVAAVPVFWALLALALRYYYRRAPRKGPKSRLPMQRLSEAEEDAFLSSAQQKEEELGAKSYDVWTTADKKEWLILDYSRSSIYQPCPKCKAKTYRRAFSRTLLAATTAQAGKRQEKYACAHCGHESVRLIPIPKLPNVEPSTTQYRSRNYSSSGGSYSRGTSGYSSRSYSSGSGSWGGGSSGGGGAESSW